MWLMGLLGRWCGLAGEDLRQALHVYLVEDGPPAGLLQPGHQLGAQDVDLSVEDAPAVGDVVLLPLEVLDQLFEVAVGECAEIRQRFHPGSKAGAWPRGQPQVELRARCPSSWRIVSTMPRSSSSSARESSSDDPSA